MNAIEWALTGDNWFWTTGIVLFFEFLILRYLNRQKGPPDRW